jgi:hypothetical protein
VYFSTFVYFLEGVQFQHIRRQKIWVEQNGQSLAFIIEFILWNRILSVI